jgi:hypothetical protein
VIVPRGADRLAEKIDETAQAMQQLDARLTHVALVPARSLPPELRTVRPDMPASHGGQNAGRGHER